MRLNTASITPDLPLLLSSRRAVFVLGLIVLVGSATADLFYWHAFQSVRCFFAAAGSVVLLGHFTGARGRHLPAARTRPCRLARGGKPCRAAGGSPLKSFVAFVPCAVGP